MTVKDFCDATRAYLKVKWRHQGRSRITGVDCVGLFICVAQDLGIQGEDDRNYGKRPGSARLIGKILDACDEVPVSDRQPGDFLLVSVAGEDPQHIMLLTDLGTLIHSSARHRMVVEHGFDDETRRGLCKVFRMKGIITR